MSAVRKSFVARIASLFMAVAMVASTVVVAPVSAFATVDGAGGSNAGASGSSGVFTGHKIVTVFADDVKRAHNSSETDYNQQAARLSTVDNKYAGEAWWYNQLTDMIGGQIVSASSGMQNNRGDFTVAYKEAIDRAVVDACARRNALSGGGWDPNNLSPEQWESLAPRVVAMGAFVQHPYAGTNDYQGGKSFWINRLSLIRYWPSGIHYEQYGNWRPGQVRNVEKTLSMSTWKRGRNAVDNYDIPAETKANGYTSYVGETTLLKVRHYGELGWHANKVAGTDTFWGTYVSNLNRELNANTTNNIWLAFLAVAGDQVDGYLQLKKQSEDNMPWVENNDMYSIAGAQYAVYENRSDAESDRNRVSLSSGDGDDTISYLTTGKNGETEVVSLSAGDYFVKEITPSKGHYIDKTVYQVTVSTENDEDNPAVVQSKDRPASLSEPVRVLKLSGDNLEMPLAGARFQVDYYDQVAGSVSDLQTSHRKATWVLETNDKGVALFDPAYMVNSLSSQVWCDFDGNAIVPLGTLTVKEITAPAGYHMTNSAGVNGESDTYLTSITLTDAQAMAADGDVAFTKLAPAYYVQGKLMSGESSVSINMPTGFLGSNGSAADAVIVTDVPKRADVELFKVDEDRAEMWFSKKSDGEGIVTAALNEAQGDAQDLHGAVFRIVSDNADAVTSPVTGEQVSRGGEVCRIVTDAEGHATTVRTASGWMPTASGSPFYPKADTHPGFSLKQRSAINGWTLSADMLAAGGALPCGTYLVYEVSAPDGYMPNPSWVGVVHIPDTIAGDGSEVFTVKTKQ